MILCAKLVIVVIVHVMCAIPLHIYPRVQRVCNLRQHAQEQRAAETSDDTKARRQDLHQHAQER